jgi:hypothetical protein
MIRYMYILFILNTSYIYDDDVIYIYDDIIYIYTLYIHIFVCVFVWIIYFPITHATKMCTSKWSTLYPSSFNLRPGKSSIPL